MKAWFAVSQGTAHHINVTCGLCSHITGVVPNRLCLLQVDDSHLAYLNIRFCREFPALLNGRGHVCLVTPVAQKGRQVRLRVEFCRLPANWKSTRHCWPVFLGFFSQQLLGILMGNK